MVLSITLTLPEKIIAKIDRERGDVNRNKYVSKLLETAYQKQRNEQGE
jgi:metal-responsive CopG/Arc/MetJ family transcriptional regulator